MARLPISPLGEQAGRQGEQWINGRLPKAD